MMYLHILPLRNSCVLPPAHYKTKLQLMCTNKSLWAHAQIFLQIRHLEVKFLKQTFFIVRIYVTTVKIKYSYFSLPIPRLAITDITFFQLIEDRIIFC